MKACVLQFDRLPCCVLGAYGAFTGASEAFDRLAAQSVVFDWCFAGGAGGAACAAAGDRLAARVPVREVRWEPESSGAAGDSMFDSLFGSTLDQSVPGGPARDTSPGGPGAGLVRVLHPGLPPGEMAANLLRGTEALARLDALVDRVHRRIAAREDDEWLLVVTARQGDGLEDPGILRDTGIPPRPAGLLRETQIHVPLLLWTRNTAAGLGVRRPELVTTASVTSTLLEWFGIEDPSAPAAAVSLLAALRHGPVESPECVVSRGTAGQWCLRTRQWLLAASLGVATGASEDDGDRPPLALYRKPDDYWDAMDVADQFPDETERLLKRLREECGRESALEER